MSETAILQHLHQGGRVLRFGRMYPKAGKRDRNADAVGSTESPDPSVTCKPAPSVEIKADLGRRGCFWQTLVDWADETSCPWAFGDGTLPFRVADERIAISHIAAT
jgi:hypothetical protein